MAVTTRSLIRHTKSMDEVMERMESLLTTSDSNGIYDGVGHTKHSGHLMDSYKNNSRHLDDTYVSHTHNGLETSQLLDTDSGLGNTWGSPGKLSSSFTCMKPSRDDIGVSRSADVYPSPRPAKSLQEGLPQYGSDRFHGQYLHLALEESENRRSLLTEKLKDARNTIHMQSERLSEIESTARENDFSLRDLKLKEKEYKKQLSDLERQKQEYQTYKLESFRNQEQLQDRLQNLELELKTLKSQYTVLQSDQRKRQEMLETTGTAMTALEEENRKLNMARESLAREVATLKDSADLAKKRNEWLEGHNQELREDMAKVKEENRSIALQAKETSMQMNDLKLTNQQLKADSKQTLQTMQIARQENKRRIEEIENLQASLADLQADLASVAADKERFFQEKLDLHQKLQNLQYSKEQADKTRTANEARIAELQVELSQVIAERDRREEDRNKLEEELKAVKKVGEVLSVELSNTKGQLEKLQEQAGSLEQSKQLAFKQHTLYEQEIKTLDSQLNNTRKQLETAKKDLEKEREAGEEQMLKMKEEMRHLRGERNQLETKQQELEARLRQSEQNLREHSAMQQTEINTWKSNCEKLTASLSKKELELQTHIKRIQDLEDETGLLKVNHGTYQSQYEELVECREQVLRLQEENRRLLQERAENQQVIQLLEMQKNILQKSSEGSLSKVHAKEEIQCQYDQLSAEHQVLQDKVKELEKIRDDLVREKEQRLAKGDLFLEQAQPESAGKDAKYQEIERQNKQLRDVNNLLTERLSKLEKEQSETQKQDKSAQDYSRLEEDKKQLALKLKSLQEEYNQLQSEHQRTLVEQIDNSNAAETAQISSLEKANTALEGKVTMLEGQLLLSENDQRRLKKQVASLEGQLQEERRQAQLGNSSSTQVHLLSEKVSQLEEQLQEAKASERLMQEQLHSLREQSLDDVGEELTNMRTELQKLLEVIQVKDASIEDLEGQLKTCKERLADRGATGSDVNQRLAELQKEKLELSVQVTKLTKERDLSLQDAADLREGMEDLQQMYEEEQERLTEKLKRDLRGKDRMIESLEEQLQQATMQNCKKLRRGLSDRRSGPQPQRSLSPEADRSSAALTSLRNGLRARMQTGRNPTSRRHVGVEDDGDLVAL